MTDKARAAVEEKEAQKRKHDITNDGPAKKTCTENNQHWHSTTGNDHLEIDITLASGPVNETGTQENTDEDESDEPGTQPLSAEEELSKSTNNLVC